MLECEFPPVSSTSKFCSHRLLLAAPMLLLIYLFFHTLTNLTIGAIPMASLDLISSSASSVFVIVFVLAAFIVMLYLLHHSQHDLQALMVSLVTWPIRLCRRAT